MKIIHTTAKAMGEGYPRLFLDCFGEWHDHHIPDFVLLSVTEDDTDIMGFLSCFQSKQDEVYVMWGGFREEYRGIGVRRRLKEARDYLHKRYKYVITTVSADNNPMLRLYLSIGYKVYGTKFATDKEVYVELISEKD